MLTLWGRASSVNVQKALWLLSELDLPYERVDVGGPFGGLDTPEFRAMSPTGLIPVLVDARRAGTRAVVWESPAILRYLAAAEGAETLWPADPAARAPIDAWGEWAQTAVHGPLVQLFLGIIRTPQAERDRAMLSAAKTKLAAQLAIAETALAEREWIAGPSMSLADILFGSALHRILTLEIDAPASPAMNAYYARLKARPAYAAHVAVDYEAMRVPGAERSASPVV